MIRCTQCGARKKRATDPCIYCGAAGARKSNGSLPILLIVLAALLIAIPTLLLAGSITDGNSAENLVDTWITAINEDDASLLTTVFPEICLDGTNVVPDFAAEYLDHYRDRLAEEYGDDFYVSAVIESTASADDSHDLLTIIYEEADIEVEQAKTLDIELSIEGAKKSDTETVTLTIIKVDGDWYFDVLDSYFS